MSDAAPGPRSRRPRLGSERGEVTTFVLAFALVILTFVGCVHVALVMHGRSVVSAAAQDALRAVQAEDGTEADAIVAAEEVLALASGLKDASVTVSASDDVNRVVVVATVESPLGDAFTTVTAQVEGPKERFYSEAERE